MTVPAPRLSLVVCCCDEEAALPRLFDELDRLDRLASGRGLSVEELFVDDGSRDGTAALLARRCADRPASRWIAHRRNRGFGAAMRTGFRAARGEVLVCYDADATYPVEDVLTLLDALADADVAGASPFCEGGTAEAGPFRTALSRGVAALYRRALRRRGPPLTAYTCAFRAYRREALAGIEHEADDFLAAAELLARLVLAGRRVREAPSRLTARRDGVSKMRVGRTALRHLGLLLRIWLRRPPFRPPPAPPRREAVSPPRPEDLAAWNAALNRTNPMAKIDRHPNPLVRWIEERRRREVVRLAAARPGVRALDVGAEEGALCRRLADGGAVPIAADIDVEALRRGRSGHGAPCVAGDAQALPLRSGAFPVVLLAEVLEHCPDPEAALREALRVAAPGGRVALSVPDDVPILALKRAIRRLGLGRLIRGLPPGRAPGHLHVFGRERLTRLLRDAGRVVVFARDLRGLAFFAAVAPRGGEEG